MKTFAQILNGRLHWKFDAEEKPEFAADIALVDITGVSPAPAEGDVWDGEKFATPAGPNDEERAAGLKGLRDSLVTRTDWLVQRHRDELDMQRATTMSAEAFAALLEYRQALRDVSLAAGFPHVDMPALPSVIAEMLGVA